VGENPFDRANLPLMKGGWMIKHMEIILMRHGEPQYRGAKVSYREMAEWIESYNRSSTGSDRPPEMANPRVPRAHVSQQPSPASPLIVENAGV
jgi:hypothetical protein